MNDCMRNMSLCTRELFSTIKKSANIKKSMYYLEKSWIFMHLEQNNLRERKDDIKSYTMTGEQFSLIPSKKSHRNSLNCPKKCHPLTGSF